MSARHDRVVVIGLGTRRALEGLAALLVAGERPEHDLTLLSPDRFG